MRYIDTDGMPVTVYQPNERQGGLFWGVKQASSDIYVSRHVIARLFWRDFVTQFRQKILGYFWALLTPLLGIINFLFLYFTGVLNPGEGSMPYTLYLLLGSNIWACLPGAISAVGDGLRNQSELIMRTRIPKIALAASSLANLGYATLINMATMFIVFCLYGIMPSWWFLLYPLLVLPMLILGAAIGMLLSALGVIARDLTPVVVQVLGLLMYITPVVYLRSAITHPVIRILIDYNPMTYLVDMPRSLLVNGNAENVSLFLLVTSGIIVLTVICVRGFYLLEDLVAERL